MKKGLHLKLNKIFIIKSKGSAIFLYSNYLNYNYFLNQFLEEKKNKDVA